MRNAWIICCVLPTWWLSRGGCTRSHSEHGRETPQRQWYFVSRRGRVGRCQVCKTQLQIFSFTKTGSSPIKRPLLRPLCYNKTINAGWSSPVARQAHNLKAAGSNPAPATKFYLEIIIGLRGNSEPFLCWCSSSNLPVRSLST